MEHIDKRRRRICTLLLVHHTYAVVFTRWSASKKLTRSQVPVITHYALQISRGRRHTSDSPAGTEEEEEEEEEKEEKETMALLAAGEKQQVETTKKEEDEEKSKSEAPVSLRKTRPVRRPPPGGTGSWPQ